MVKSCCAVGCTSRFTKEKAITFHLFPKAPSLREQWIKAIDRLDFVTKKPWQPSPHDYVCSKHFKPSDFVLTRHAQHKKLKKDVVPSIMSWKTREKVTQSMSRTSTVRQEASAMPECPASVNPYGDQECAVDLTTSKRRIEEASDQLENIRKGLRNGRKKKKISQLSVSALLQEARGMHALSLEASNVLEVYKDIPIDLFSKPANKYSDEQKQFASTLYFYEPKVYSYLKEKFNLPNPSTLQRWLRNSSSNPGMSSQVLDMLAKKRQEDPTNFGLCTLMIDGMSIRKQVDWDNKRKEMVGFVDFGSGPLESEAREALVILVVGLRGYWKVPVAYFLVNGVSSEVLSQLILSALSSLHEVHMRCVAVVIGGHPTNVKTAEVLGCTVEPNKMKCSFTHPADASSQVYIFFDACHLLKSLRDSLYALQEVSEPSIGTARWKDIARLESLQGCERLRGTNKLTTGHVYCPKKKMNENMNMTAQTLGASVAKSLDYGTLRNYSGFEDCHGSVRLISLVDHLFDVFNGRTAACKGFKGPLRTCNLPDRESFLMEVKSVLLNLKDMAGTKVCVGKHKIAVLGFAFNIDSLLGLAKELLLGDNPPLKFLLTYKLSQDHLELLFSSIRRYGEWIQNPSASQFASAYNALLNHAGIIISSDVRTNYIAQGTTSVLNVDALTNTPYQPVLSFREPFCHHDHISNGSRLRSFVENIVEYIAGWVVRDVATQVSCQECSAALVQKARLRSQSGLLELKNSSGLVIPSDDVIKVLNHCQIVLSYSLNAQHVQSSRSEKVAVSKLMAGVPSESFSSLNSHFLETARGIDTHYCSLIQMLCEKYLSLRRYHSANLTSLTREDVSVGSTIV